MTSNRASSSPLPPLPAEIPRISNDDNIMSRLYRQDRAQMHDSPACSLMVLHVDELPPHQHSCSLCGKKFRLDWPPPNPHDCLEDGNKGLGEYAVRVPCGHVLGDRCAAYMCSGPDPNHVQECWFCSEKFRLTPNSFLRLPGMPLAEPGGRSQYPRGQTPDPAPEPDQKRPRHHAQGGATTAEASSSSSSASPFPDELADRLNKYPFFQTPKSGVQIRGGAGSDQVDGGHGDSRRIQQAPSHSQLHRHGSNVPSPLGRFGNNSLSSVFQDTTHRRNQHRDLSPSRRRSSTQSRGPGDFLPPPPTPTTSINRDGRGRQPDQRSLRGKQPVQSSSQRGLFPSTTNQPAGYRPILPAVPVHTPLSSSAAATATGAGRGSLSTRGPRRGTFTARPSDRQRDQRSLAEQREEASLRRHPQRTGTLRSNVTAEEIAAAEGLMDMRYGRRGW